ncbi:alcohol acetyltransferase [Truncatella angustata]|uniref:Alcohol acetyltransferase n=1 Tax=Truncatella angustata TaxID=152316 RepID=A0A9P8RKG9_9PEZI|nr:alcohol acetyltransferase [Truncatella angustata]KAH6644980.1 alcohol acetyltransferase [Truncatella angustata]
MSCFGHKDAAKGSVPDVLRRIGPVEGYQSAQHLLGFYCACAVTSQYTFQNDSITRPKGISLRNVLENALALTILEHPLLQVGLIDENSKRPAWIQLDSVDFRINVEWRDVLNPESSRETLLDTLQTQHDSPFRELSQRPAWRVVVLRSDDSSDFEVVFAWNHTVADGMSGKIFHQTLLRNLNHTYSAQHPAIELVDHVLKLPKLSKLTPPLEELLKFPISPAFVATEGWQSMRPSFLGSKSQYAATWAPMRRTPLKTVIRLVEIPKQDLERLLMKCRQEKTTLTGLLHAVTLLAFATRLNANQARAFEAGTPFDLRRFMSSMPPGHAGLDPHQTVGNLVAYFTHKFDADIVASLRNKFEKAMTSADILEELERGLWSEATVFRERITQRLEAGTKNTSLGLVKFVGDWRKFLKDEFKKPRAHSWEVSNLGVLDGQIGGDAAKEGQYWTIKSAVFSQSAAVIGPAYLISPVTVKGGSLTLGCTWQYEVLDQTLAIGVTNDLQTWLIDIAQGKALTLGKR